MWQNILNFFTPQENNDSELEFYKNEVRALKNNQKVLQNYTLALARLMFVEPNSLKREVANEEANSKYTVKLYEPEPASGNKSA